MDAASESDGPQAVREPFQVAGRIVILITAAGLAQRPLSQAQETPSRHRSPFQPHFAPSHAGAAMTSPNYGAEGTLDVLAGGGSSRVWSFDVASNIWRALVSAPVDVGPGGSISSLINGCDFAFAGGGSRGFFSTGMACDLAGVLADAPAPVGAGAALATAPGLVGALRESRVRASWGR